MKRKTIFNNRSQIGVNSMILLSLVLLATTFSQKAFSQKLTFTFDASGNQIKRLWVCINCPTVNISGSEGDTSVGETNLEVIYIEDSYRLHIDKQKRTVQVHPKTENRFHIPKVSLFDVGNKRTIALDQLKRDDYVEFSTENLIPGIYHLRISKDDKTWTEVIIKKVKEV
ncbi:hypothetical protein ACP6L2_13110 [Sphingobacterium lactis]|uniref:hypothetical protein n=1 Tax=Sphingobacterium lactis TaxID=797291 RepID=UPI003F818C67